MILRTVLNKAVCTHRLVIALFPTYCRVSVHRPIILIMFSRHPRLLVCYCRSSILHALLDDIDGQHVGLLLGALPGEFCIE